MIRRTEMEMIEAQAKSIFEKIKGEVKITPGPQKSLPSLCSRCLKQFEHYKDLLRHWRDRMQEENLSCHK
jgi:hypothetical protein